MPARRFPPLLVWSLVVAVSILLLGGSFAYAARVGDPTVREDALRRGPRPGGDVTTTQPGSFGGGGIGGGGVGSPPFDGGAGPQAGAGSRSGSGTFAFLSSDFARVLPPATCVTVLEDLVRQGPVSLAEVTDAWDFVLTCAAAQGQAGIPALEIITSDPLAQQCLAVALARTTLAYRSPTVPLGALDQLLVDCQARGVVPPLPGLTGGLPPTTATGGGVPTPTATPATPATDPASAPGATVTTAAPPAPAPAPAGAPAPEPAR